MDIAKEDLSKKFSVQFQQIVAIKDIIDFRDGAHTVLVAEAINFSAFLDHLANNDLSLNIKTPGCKKLKVEKVFSSARNMNISSVKEIENWSERIKLEGDRERRWKEIIEDFDHRVKQINNIEDEEMRKVLEMENVPPCPWNDEDD